jgi:hypothetical protein
MPVPLHTRRVVTKKGLKEKGIDISDTHLDRLISRGLFPAPDMWLTARKPCWWDTTLDAHLDRLAEGSKKKIAA